MKLPQQYDWLYEEPGPKMLKEAIALFGTKEKLGPANNPEIMRWADELGKPLRKVYTADSIPWCGLFIAIVALRAGKPECAQPLWARSWASWGDKSPVASLGDVLVFVRDGGGHVGLYVGEDHLCYHVLGGNQGDAVSIVRIAKARCIAVRHFYRNKPDNVRRIVLAPSGVISRNES